VVWIGEGEACAERLPRYACVSFAAPNVLRRTDGKRSFRAGAAAPLSLGDPNQAEQESERDELSARFSGRRGAVPNTRCQYGALAP
jgi:hypothetical protein